MQDKLKDLERECVDCGRPFIITISEQRFFLTREPQPVPPPKRCKPCREHRRAIAQVELRQKYE
jgi:hypothetical protein